MKIPLLPFGFFGTSNSSNTVPKDQPIDIIIHENKPKAYYVGGIMPNIKLSTVRNMLENKEEIYMGENMNFLSKNNINNIEKIIPIKEEKAFIVSDIIFSDGQIHILKDANKVSLSQFVNKHKLLYGCCITREDIIERVPKKRAFNLKEGNTVIINNTSYKGLERDTMKCKERIEQMFARSFIINGNVSVPLPWALTSLDLGSHIKNSKEEKLDIEESYEYTYVNAAKCSISISHNDIEPTSEFIDAIDSALKQNTDEEKLKEIKKISQEFGFIFPMYIEFGGKIQSRIESHSKRFSDFKEKTVGGGIQNTSLTYNSKKGTSSSKFYANDSFRVVGGDETIVSDDNNGSESQKKWLKTLDHCDKWQPINYSEIISVYELLDSKKRVKLLELLGKVVLHSGTNEIEFNNKNIIEPKKLQIDIPENILDNMENNHVYATVYNTECINEIFSVHVVYYPNKSSNLILNCVKTKKEKELLSKKDFKHIVKVSWIIVGSQNVKRDLPKEIVRLNHNMCCLGICAFRCQDTDDYESTIAAGLHLCRVDGQKWEPCTYIFDIAKVHLSNINAIQEYEMKWEEDKNSTYKGEEWDKFSREGNLFLGLLYKKYHSDCSPVFVNVNTRYPMMRSLKKTDDVAVVGRVHDYAVYIHGSNGWWIINFNGDRIATTDELIMSNESNFW
ncbi:12061_t:CDS:2, partial [Cetraspora pellucida]